MYESGSNVKNQNRNVSEVFSALKFLLFCLNCTFTDAPKKATMFDMFDILLA